MRKIDHDSGACGIYSPEISSLGHDFPGYMACAGVVSGESPVCVAALERTCRRNLGCGRVPFVATTKIGLQSRSVAVDDTPRTEAPAVRIPRVRFTIRSMMILVVLIAVRIGVAVFTYRQSRDQLDDGFINDPMHPRWRIPGSPAPKGTPTGPDTRRPIRR